MPTKKPQKGDAKAKAKTKVEVMRSPAGRATYTIGRLMADTSEEFDALLFDLSQSIMLEIQQINSDEAGSKKVQEILASQALTLDALFQRLTYTVSLLISQPEFLLGQSEFVSTLMGLAFRAQDQSRKTFVALEELKNPKRSTTFIKNYVDKQLQMNVDAQPVNQLPENEYASVDIRSQTTTSRNYPEVETLGELHRATN